MTANQKYGANPNICEKDYIFIRRDDSAVILFAKFRVPLCIPKEKKTIIAPFKEELIRAIGGLSNRGGRILQARYGNTKKDGRFDVENVLFYNIGPSKFNLLAETGVEFSFVEKDEVEKLQERYNVSSEYSHFYEYKVEESSQRDYPKLLAEWSSIPLKCVGLKLIDVWRAMRRAKEKITIYDRIDCAKSDTFAIVLEIEKPENEKLKLVSAMKSLIDGLVCVFHSATFTKEEEEGIANRLEVNIEELLDVSITTLGERKGLVKPYRRNVKWDPADHLCSHVYVTVKSGREWGVSGKIYSTVKCPNCGNIDLTKLDWERERREFETEEITPPKVLLAGICTQKQLPRYVCKNCKTYF